MTVDGNPVACVGDKTGCGATIIEGAPLAIVDGDLIAFVGAKTDHGGTLISGSPSVMVGTGNVNGRDKTCIREKMTDEEKFIYDNRDSINRPTRIIDNHELPIKVENNKIESDLIGAIIIDELQRRDFSDSMQDIEAKFIKYYEGGLEDVERWLLKNTFKEIENISLGSSQMKPNVVFDLVHNDYIEKPDNWSMDKLDISIKWLLDPRMSAKLVAARVEQTVEHWAEGGVDISNRPEIIGTLYSLGLTGEGGVHGSPKSTKRGERIGNELKNLAKKILACP